MGACAQADRGADENRHTRAGREGEGEVQRVERGELGGTGVVHSMRGSLEVVINEIGRVLWAAVTEHLKFGAG